MTQGPHQPVTKLSDFPGQQWGSGRAFEEIGHALQCIKMYVGKWYKWGGDTPEGFDCSGLACEYLKMLGILARRSDYTAQSLTTMIPTHRALNTFLPGDLLFFGESQSKIVHVEICLTRYLAIGASGGGSNTKSVGDAIRDRAFIKIRPIIVGRGQTLQLFGNTQAALLKVFATGQPIA